MRTRPGSCYGGVEIDPDPPEPGKDVEVTIDNDAGELYWTIPGHSKGKVKTKDGKAKIPVPTGTGGKTLFIDAGDPPHVVDAEFEIKPETG